MIFKRFAANLRAQNWFAIGVEFAIVVAGVFVGTQVSNWNDERRSVADTDKVLRGLDPEIRNTIDNFGRIQVYYRTTRAYADSAFAGWRGEPSVSDKAFVIAAYQASQNTFSSIDISSWSEVLGGDRLRTIDDPQLRKDLTTLMTTDIKVIEREVFTAYRENVRKVIPEDIQDAIRGRCGDRRLPGGGVMLPPSGPTANFASACRCRRRLRWPEPARALPCRDR